MKRLPKWLRRLPVTKALGASKHERGRRRTQGWRRGNLAARKRARRARKAQRGR